MEYLYHGTDIDSAKNICNSQYIDVTVGARHSDFGQGFYTTDDFERACIWAKHKASVRGKKAGAVIKLVVDLEIAAQYIESFDDDLRWGRFIMNNRNGYSYINQVQFKENNLDAKYAITYGRIADIDVYEIAKKLKQEGKMLHTIDGILNKNYSMQYAFHTSEALKCIKKMSYQQV